MKVTLLRQEVERILVDYVMNKIDHSCGNPVPVLRDDTPENFEGYEIEVND